MIFLVDYSFGFGLIELKSFHKSIFLLEKQKELFDKSFSISNHKYK
ncbi:hypothetical protein LEP1GSC074_2469 [Leptospira noguchii str. Hook]|uniref:Uncharacterized protein n=1 Tax=Leptospira noguchii serovar Autumnalis str. ZUN142 TaxID=1085540 RepID=M6UDJ2_9LEPT|nr:hypothetical protein LEP1GSC186_2529 [Leptospira noguchii serovar Autumnalis str. ZUN142]EMS88674.1 hypothetical protein LEP1GSC074_2469 [Leptospira noguchii str. Hook]